MFYRGGYLFPQAFYYRLQLDKTCRKLRDKYRFKYDINAILSDLIYARILEPASKRSSYETASEFLEKPSYQLHDVYRALDVLGKECDFIQSEVYKNSHLLGNHNIDTPLLYLISSIRSYCHFPFSAIWSNPSRFSSFFKAIPCPSSPKTIRLS